MDSHFANRGGRGAVMEELKRGRGRRGDGEKGSEIAKMGV